MTTAGDLVNEAKAYLLAGHREPYNTLSGVHSAATTTFTFNYDVSAIQPGNYIGVDLEVVYVVSTVPASKQATVIRGMLGSTAASHVDTSITTLNPRFSDWRIFQEINHDLADLCSPSNGMFWEKEVTITYNPSIQGYDITGTTIATLNEILEVRYREYGPTKIWPEIKNYLLKRFSDTTDFPSSNALVLEDSAAPGRDVRIVYAQNFASLAALTDDVLVVSGLPLTAHDLPPLGAAFRLLSMREPQRNFNESQPDTRRAQEVPPGAQYLSVRGISDLRARRIKAEAGRFLRRWPQKRRVA